MAVSKMKNPFCVIGRNPGNYPSAAWRAGAGRTFLATESAAAEHATRLLLNQGGTPGTRLFIVKVVGVVEVPSPAVAWREPTADDD